jgi:hypothetical protein
MIGGLMNSEWERIWKEAMWANYVTVLGIVLEGLEEDHEYTFV